MSSRLENLLYKKTAQSVGARVGNLELGFTSLDIGVANKFAWKAILNIAREDNLSLYMISTNDGCFLITGGITPAAKELQSDFNGVSLFIREEEHKVSRIENLIKYLDKAEKVYFSGGRSSKGLYFSIQMRNQTPFLIDTDSIERVNIEKNNFFLEIRIPSPRSFSQTELEFLLDLVKKYQINLRVWRDFWSGSFSVEIINEGLTKSFRLSELTEERFLESWYKEELYEVIRSRAFLENAPESFWESLLGFLES